MHAKSPFLVVPAGLTLLLVLSACTWFDRLPSWSDTTESDAPVVEEPTATPSPTSTRTPSPTPTPTPTPTPVPDLTRDDLEALLLGLDDLPPEWIVVEVDDHPTEVPGAGDLDGTLVSAVFQRSDLGPFLVHALLLSGSESDARTALEAIEEELATADMLDELTDEVRSSETQRLPFEDLGDETVAFEAVGDTGLLPVEAHMVAWRSGRFVSLIIHGQVISVDVDRTEEFARTAVERLPD